MGGYNRGGGDAARKLKAEKQMEAKEKAKAKLPTFRGMGFPVFTEDEQMHGVGGGYGSNQTQRSVDAKGPMSMFKEKEQSLLHRKEQAPTVDLSATLAQQTRSVLSEVGKAEEATQDQLTSEFDVGSGGLFDLDDNNTADASIIQSSPVKAPSNVVSQGSKLNVIEADWAMTTEIKDLLIWHDSITKEVERRLNHLHFKSYLITSALDYLKSTRDVGTVIAMRQTLDHDLRSVNGGVGYSSAIHGLAVHDANICIEWLLLTVPTAQLPTQQSGVVNHAGKPGSGANQVRNQLIELLHNYGFPRTECVEAVDDSGMNIHIALGMLSRWFKLNNQDMQLLTKIETYPQYDHEVETRTRLLGAGYQWSVHNTCVLQLLRTEGSIEDPVLDHITVDTCNYTADILAEEVEVLQCTFPDNIHIENHRVRVVFSLQELGIVRNSQLALIPNEEEVIIDFYGLGESTQGVEFVYPNSSILVFIRSRYLSSVCKLLSAKKCMELTANLAKEEQQQCYECIELQRQELQTMSRTYPLSDKVASGREKENITTIKDLHNLGISYEKSKKETSQVLDTMFPHIQVDERGILINLAAQAKKEQIKDIEDIRKFCKKKTVFRDCLKGETKVRVDKAVACGCTTCLYNQDVWKFLISEICTESVYAEFKRSIDTKTTVKNRPTRSDKQLETTMKEIEEEETLKKNRILDLKLTLCEDTMRTQHNGGEIQSVQEEIAMWRSLLRSENQIPICRAHGNDNKDVTCEKCLEIQTVMKQALARSYNALTLQVYMESIGELTALQQYLDSLHHSSKQNALFHSDGSSLGQNFDGFQVDRTGITDVWVDGTNVDTEEITNSMDLTQLTIDQLAILPPSLTFDLPFDRKMAMAAVAQEQALEMYKERMSTDTAAKDNINAKALRKECRASAEYKKQYPARMQLPSVQMAAEVAELLKSNQCFLIEGATGCGKSTQVPQLVLDALLDANMGGRGMVVCTQPRRLAATAIADRVSKERGGKLGDEVGYQIRSESRRSAKTRLLYATQGILLRQMVSNPLLTGVAAVIVDEVHEQSVDVEILLVLLKEVMLRRPDLIVILMSATFDVESISQYMGNFEDPASKKIQKIRQRIKDARQRPDVNGNLISDECVVCNAMIGQCSCFIGRSVAHEVPILSIPGRTFPVEHVFLEDIYSTTGFVQPDGTAYTRRGRGPTEEERNQLVADLKTLGKQCTPTVQNALLLRDPLRMNVDAIAWLLKHILSNNIQGHDGSILVFVPGVPEINELLRTIPNHEHLASFKRQLQCLPLHAGLNTNEQQECFRNARSGMVKIIFSTNVAETSVTIDDVTVVLDTCLAKEMSYDAKIGLHTLATVEITKANVKQRAGRAGRVRPGVAYHLTPTYAYNAMRKVPIPEMRRVPLDSTMLQLMVSGYTAVDRQLQRVPSPPSAVTVASTMKQLEKLDAITTNATVTAVGRQLSLLPVELQHGKMQIYACALGCVDAVLTLVAMMSDKDVWSQEAQAQKRIITTDTSDFSAMLEVYKGFLQAVYERREKAYCIAKGVYLDKLHDCYSKRKELYELLLDIGVIAGKRVGGGQRQHTQAYRGELTNDQGKFMVYWDNVTHAMHPFYARHARNTKLVHGCLLAALDSNQCVNKQYVHSKAEIVRKSEEGFKKVYVSSGTDSPLSSRTLGDVQIHPSSIVSSLASLPSNMLLYGSVLSTSRTFLRHVATVSPAALILFGNGQVHYNLGLVTSEDGWEVAILPVTAVLMKKLGEAMQQWMKAVSEVLYGKNKDEQIEHRQTDIKVVDLAARVLLEEQGWGCNAALGMGEIEEKSEDAKDCYRQVEGLTTIKPETKFTNKEYKPKREDYNNNENNTKDYKPKNEYTNTSNAKEYKPKTEREFKPKGEYKGNNSKSQSNDQPDRYERYKTEVTQVSPSTNDSKPPYNANKANYNDKSKGEYKGKQHTDDFKPKGEYKPTGEKKGKQHKPYQPKE